MMTTNSPSGRSPRRRARNQHEPFKLPIELHPKQQQFFDDDRFEIFLGGSAGGGKSVGQLAAALKFAHMPGSSAILIREAYTHLEQAGGLIPMSREWLANTGAVYNQARAQWTFPSGAVLAFGHLGDDSALNRVMGAEYAYIGVDEASQIPPHRLEFLFSRLRRREGVNVPLRYRLSSNPGGPAHQWLKERYVDAEETPDRCFIPSKVSDNPSLPFDEYVRSLSQLDPLTRERLLEGNWDAVPDGEVFRRSWFLAIRRDQVPRGLRWVRFWDLAATEGGGDYTAGALVGRHKDTYFVGDLVRFQADASGVATRIKRVAELDGKRVRIYLEQEPGSSGKITIDYFAKRVLRNFRAEGVRTTGSKVDRARPVATAAAGGNLLLVEGHWNADFLDEAAAFPVGSHDDQIDAVSGGFAQADYEPFRTFSFRITDL